jgi:mRNA-degrading endonuclease RelE of RelBE toxin-antitoxin system
MNIIALPSFNNSLKQLAKKYPSIPDDYEALLDRLDEDPLQGAAPIGKNCYKVRFAIASKKTGKRDNSRVIMCLKLQNDTIHLLDIYEKAERSTVSDTELKRLLKQID